MPSLRATIGAMTACIVLAVAATTLSVTLTYSIDALRTIGKTHAEAMLQKASGATARYLKSPVDVVTALQADSALFSSPSPGDDRTNATMPRLAASHCAALLAVKPDLESLFTIFRDGSLINARAYTNHVEIRATITRDNVPFFAFPAMELYTSNMSVVPPALRAVPRAPIDYRFAFSGVEDLTPLFSVLNGSLRTAAFWYPVDTGMTTRTDASGATVVDVSLRAVKIARNATHDLGMTSGNIPLAQMSNFLVRARTTPGAQAFVVDTDGLLLGATHAARWLNIRELTPTENPPARLGCAVTRNPGARFEGCRLHAADHPFAPLRHVANNTAMLVPRGVPQVEYMRIGTQNYFVAREVIIPPSSIGLSVVMVLFLPEEDVLGDVRTGRNIAIGITAAVFVVATAVAVVAVSVVLSPLGTIADRMSAAASLQDDSDDMEPSAMSEIAALQQSYAALNSQLNKLKSFVPQSVLATLTAHTASDDSDGPDDEDDEGDLISFVDELEMSASLESPNRSMRASVSQAEYVGDGARAAGTSGRRSTVHLPGGADDAAATEPADAHRPLGRVKSSDLRGQRRQSRANLAVAGRQSSHGTSRVPPGAAAAGLNLAVGITERSVTVVMINLRGFHAETTRGALANLPVAYADFIDTVTQVCKEQHGVLDSFHGDRVMLTFNAARPTLSHARRGTQAAVAVASAELGLFTPVMAGVATGRALVGNLGGAAAKRFCTVSPVVGQAAALLRLAATYSDSPMPKSTVTPGSRVLVSGRMLDDLQATFVLRPMDFTRLARGEGPGTCIAEVIAAVDTCAGNDEWLYVVGSGNKATDGCDHEAACMAHCTATFLRLAEGRLPEARAELQEAAGRGAVSEPHPTLERARAAVEATDSTAETSVIRGRNAGIVW